MIKNKFNEASSLFLKLYKQRNPEYSKKSLHSHLSLSNGVDAYFDKDSIDKDCNYIPNEFAMLRFKDIEVNYDSKSMSIDSSTELFNVDLEYWICTVLDVLKGMLDSEDFTQNDFKLTDTLERSNKIITKEKVITKEVENPEHKVKADILDTLLDRNIRFTD